MTWETIVYRLAWGIVIGAVIGAILGELSVRWTLRQERRLETAMSNIQKEAWPYIRKATAYQMQQWAFLAGVTALSFVKEHAPKLKEAERDWLIDYLTPLQGIMGYEHVHDKAKDVLSHLRKPPKRLAPVVEALFLHDVLPGQMNAAALGTVYLALQLALETCSADVVTQLQASMLASLAVIVENEPVETSQSEEEEAAFIDYELTMLEAEDEGPADGWADEEG